LCRSRSIAIVCYSHQDSAPRPRCNETTGGADLAEAVGNRTDIRFFARSDWGKMKTNRLLVTAIGAILALGLSAPAASAAPDAEQASPKPGSALTPKATAESKATTSLLTQGQVPASGASTFAVSTGVAPGCAGTLDAVHPSAGLASVHGRTTCAGSSRNFISLSIGYIGWFGERYAVAYNSAQNAKTYVEGQVKSVCAGKGWQTWRAFGYHSSVLGGRTYYGNTARDGRFNC